MIHDDFVQYLEGIDSIRSKELDDEGQLDNTDLEKLSRLGILDELFKVSDSQSVALLLRIIIRVAAKCGNLRNLFLVNYGMVGRFLAACYPLASEIEKSFSELATGRKFAAIAITEKSGGSNPRSQTTCIEQIDSNFILTGEKRWITCGYIADFFLVQAWFHNELRFVYVPAAVTGVHAERIERPMGARGSGLGVIKFDRVRIKPDWILPKTPHYFSKISSMDYVMRSGRLFAGASALGIGLAALDGATKVLRKKTNLRGSLYTQGDWQTRIAKLHITSVALKGFLSNIAGDFDKKMKSNFDEFTPFKILSTEFSIDASYLYFEASGADAYTEKSESNRLLREAMAGNFIEGGNAVLIQKCSYDWTKLSISEGIYDPF